MEGSCHDAHPSRPRSQRSHCRLVRSRRSAGTAHARNLQCRAEAGGAAGPALVLPHGSQPGTQVLVPRGGRQQRQGSRRRGPPQTTMRTRMRTRNRRAADGGGRRAADRTAAEPAAGRAAGGRPRPSHRPHRARRSAVPTESAPAQRRTGRCRACAGTRDRGAGAERRRSPATSARGCARASAGRRARAPSAST